LNNSEYHIREAQPNEFDEVGTLMVNVYSQLDGFPKKEDQPNYYKTLANVGQFTVKPKVKLLVAISPTKTIDGAVVYFGDMQYYGSGGSAPNEKNAAGFRLLAVSHNARGRGIGKLLTNYCIQLAKKEKQEQLIIHSTKSMKIAWGMYEKLGFKRSEELDFMQSDLQVFGFRLFLD
jgi:GNAT superfamily N-acetyltransferase